MTCPWCHVEDLGGLHTPEGCVEILAEVLTRVSAARPMIVPLPRAGPSRPRHRRSPWVPQSARAFGIRPTATGCRSGNRARGRPGSHGRTSCRLTNWRC